MSKSNTLEQELLDWIFKRTACPWAGETVGYLALHSGDPGEGGRTGLTLLRDFPPPVEALRFYQAH